MRLLYCALDQRVPGTLGGSVHTRSVAEGLAALGHEVHVLAAPGDGPFPSGPVSWIAAAPPLGRPHLRALRGGLVLREAARLRPDVVIERYHNFGGEGVRAARQMGARVALEVNAPILDHPRSWKARIDRALLLRPMRRWRDWQCARADLFITPTRRILPPWIDPGRVLEVEWGADTDRFRPGAPGRPPFPRPAGTLAVFAGAFRRWHGAVHLVSAIRRLRERGIRDVSAVLIGAGPELPAVREAARGLDGVVFTGALPHDDLPAALAAADVGVAPFDAARHPPLALAFYWSPLKIFEYMASGLPIVAPAIDRLALLVGHGREGLLYDAAHPDGLTDALATLREPELRARLGAAARERAVAEYSWTAHCARLDAALRRLAGEAPRAPAE
jgi:glycosyltransferase involved in cell wall biosynthesis